MNTAKNKASILSFIKLGIHPHDLGTILDGEGIAIRTGHHCAMPVMEHFKIPATARASMAFYNTKEEIDRLILGIEAAQELFEIHHEPLTDAQISDGIQDATTVKELVSLNRLMDDAQQIEYKAALTEAKKVLKAAQPKRNAENARS